MADYINNVAAADTYTAACTIGPDFAAKSLVLTIANNPALMQFAIGKLGDWRWTDEREFFSIPQAFRVANVVGVKVRNANPGQVARVLAVLSGDDDPGFESGVPFSGTLTAQGGVLPPVAALTYAVANMVGGNVPNAVFTTQALANPLVDTSGFWSNANPTRFTAPAAGTFLVVATQQYGLNAAGIRGLRILVNGAQVDSATLTVPGDGASYAGGPTHVEVVVLAKGDYVEVQSVQTSGGLLSINAGRLSIVQLGNQ